MVLKSLNNEKIQKTIVYTFLILIFLAVFGLRVYLSYNAKGFSDDTSYFVMRQAESIKQTGLPLYNDALSFGGRTNTFMPLFYYVIAFFSLFMPIDLAMNIIPNLLLSSLVFIIYFISYKIKRNKSVSIATTVVANSVPIFFSETINKIGTYDLSVPLLFCAFYFFMGIKKDRNIMLYLVSLFLLSITSPLIVVLTLFFLLYLLLSRLQDIKTGRKELELIIFTIFFSMWISFLFYKNALLLHGPSFIWQNIPSALLNSFFSDVNALELIYKVGAATLIAGLFVVYNNFLKEKNKEINYTIAFIISVSLLLWFKLIELNLGLIIFGIALSLLFGYFWVFAFRYIAKTRFYSMKIPLVIVMFLIIIPASFVPAVNYSKQVLKSTPKESMLRAFDWIAANTPENSTILSWPNDGSKIAYFTKRKNVMDLNFMLIADVNERFDDIQTIYTTPSEMEAIKLMNKYNVNYILLTPQLKGYYKIDSLAYLDERCFQKVYDDLVQIYKLKCTV